MSDREFTLLRLNVTVDDLGSDRDENESGDDGDGDGGGRSTVRLAAGAFLAAGIAGAAAVYALRRRGSDTDDGESGGDEAFDAESRTVAELDAETDRRFHRVRGAFPARLRRSTRDARPDAGAGAGSLIGLLFLLASAVAARSLAAADRGPEATADRDPETGVEPAPEAAVEPAPDRR